jgi:hypothetical protein
MNFDNVDFNCNHTYALCKHSYWRTRQPPRRVLHFASRLVATNATAIIAASA